MDFQNYAERIKALRNFETFEQPKTKYKQLMRFVVKKGDMVTTKVGKTKFSQLNDKRFYFPSDAISLPFGHPFLKEISDFKSEQEQKREKYFWQEKEKVLSMEKAAL